MVVLFVVNLLRKLERRRKIWGSWAVQKCEK